MAAPWVEDLVRRLEDRLPLTFRWFSGTRMPPVGPLEVIWFEDETNLVGKIIMRRSGRTYVFTSYNAEPGEPSDITILLDAHAWRHATAGDSSKVDIGSDPIGIYEFTWTRAHNWEPDGPTVTPIYVTLASAQVADAMKIVDNDGTTIFMVDAVNAVGINNGAPDAHLVVQATGVDLEGEVTALNPLAWWKADALTNGGNEPSDGQLANAWPDGASWYDSTGNGYNLGSVNEPADISYVANLSNSKPGVRFLGNLTRFTLAITLALNAYTTYTVRRSRPTGGLNGKILGDTSSNNFLSLPTRSGSGVTNRFRVDFGTFNPDHTVPIYVDTPDSETFHVFTASRSTAAAAGDAGNAGVVNSGNNFRLDGVDKGGLINSDAVPEFPAGTTAWSRFRCSGDSSGTVVHEDILEVIVFSVEHSSTAKETVEAYLNDKYALNGGGSGGGGLDYVQKWNDSDGNVQAQVDSAFNWGIGIDPAEAKLHVVELTEQLRLGYDDTNFASFTVGSGGDLTIAPSGGDTVVTGDLTVTLAFDSGAGKFAVNATGNIVLINNVATSWPAAQGLANRYLRNDGSGNLTWVQVDLTTGVTNTLPATNGGTGFASYAVGDLLYASSTTALARLADVAAGSLLRSGGVSTAPAWSTFTLASPGTSGNILQSDGTNWLSTSLSGGGIVAGSGTLNTIPKWTPDGVTLGNSLLSESSGSILANVTALRAVTTLTSDLGSASVLWSGLWAAAWNTGASGATITSYDGSSVSQTRLLISGGADDVSATFSRTVVWIDRLSTGAAGELRFLEPTSGGNYTAFKAQTQAADITYALPAAVAAANGAVLSSTTGGTLSWASQVAVANGGTGLASGTSGGILYFSGTTTLASSGLLTAAALVLGGGAGSSPTSLALGTANQALGMNSGATAHEYKTISGVANEIDVTHGVGTITIGLVDPLIAAKGGTGFASYTIGDLLYANTGTTLAKLIDVAAGSVLRSGGVATAPAWSAFTLAAPSTAGNILRSDGTNWTSASLITAGVVTGTGTLNALTKWTSTTGALGDSGITDNGTTLSSSRLGAWTGLQTITCATASSKALICKAGGALQLVNLQEWQNSSGNALAAVSPFGGWVVGTNQLIPGTGLDILRLENYDTALLSDGAYDTHAMLLSGTATSGGIPARVDWWVQGDVTSNAGASSFIFRSQYNAGGYTTRFSIGDDGLLTATNRLTGLTTPSGSTDAATKGYVDGLTTGGANPSATISLTAVNGSALTYLRSDGAPALSQAIIPTWTQIHTFSARDVHNAGISLGTNGTIHTSEADGAADGTLVAFSLVDQITRTTDDDDATTATLFMLSNVSGRRFMRVSHRGEFAFGSTTALAPSSGRILNFAQNVGDEPNVTYNSGIVAQVTANATNHATTGLCGVSSEFLYAAGNATFAGTIASFDGPLCCTNNGGGSTITGEMASFVSRQQSGAGPSSSWDPTNQNNLKGQWTRISGFRVGWLGPSSASNVLRFGNAAYTGGAEEINAFFGHIPGYSKIGGDQWGINLSNPSSGTSTAVGSADNDNVRVAAIRAAFPDRQETAAKANKLAHAYLVPKAATAGGPAYWTDKGGVYCDDGTNNPAGLYEHLGGGAGAWRKLLNPDSMVYVDDDIVVYEDELVLA